MDNLTIDIPEGIKFQKRNNTYDGNEYFYDIDGILINGYKHVVSYERETGLHVIKSSQFSRLKNKDINIDDLTIKCHGLLTNVNELKPGNFFTYPGEIEFNAIFLILEKRGEKRFNILEIVPVGDVQPIPKFLFISDNVYKITPINYGK